MKRLIVSALVTSLLALSLTSQASAGGESELLPNLQVRRPLKVHQAPYMKIREGDDGASRWLHFDTEVANRGPGPLELRPRTEPCDGDPQRYPTSQAVFLDDDGDGAFDREVDAAAHEYDAGCIIYHQAHDHWHFEDFAEYKLLKVKADGSLRTKAVQRADKVSFCMTDTGALTNQPPGTPGERHYLAIPQGCQQQEDGSFPPMGISVGWFDLYAWSLPQRTQALEITDLPNGPYCLRIELDPSDRLLETSEADNRRSTRIYIKGTELWRQARKSCTS